MKKNPNETFTTTRTSVCTYILFMYLFIYFCTAHSDVHLSFLSSVCTRLHAPGLRPQWKNWPLSARVVSAPLAGIFIISVRPDGGLSSCFVCASMARVSWQSVWVQLDTAGSSCATDHRRDWGLFYFLLPAAGVRYCLLGAALMPHIRLFELIGGALWRWWN